MNVSLGRAVARRAEIARWSEWASNRKKGKKIREIKNTSRPTTSGPLVAQREESSLVGLPWNKKKKSNSSIINTGTTTGQLDLDSSPFDGGRFGRFGGKNTFPISWNSISNTKFQFLWRVKCHRLPLFDFNYEGSLASLESPKKGTRSKLQSPKGNEG